MTMKWKKSCWKDIKASRQAAMQTQTRTGPYAAGAGDTTRIGAKPQPPAFKASWVATLPEPRVL